MRKTEHAFYNDNKLLEKLRLDSLIRSYTKVWEALPAGSPLFAPLPEDWLRITELTDEQIRDMKDQGLPKPPLFPKERWYIEVNVTETDYRVELIVQNAAIGRPLDYIARQIHLPQERVEQILMSPEIMRRIRDRQLEMFSGQERSAIKNLFPEAFATMQEILANREEKSSLRFQVAAYVIDQVIGRSQQSVEVKTNLLADILQKLEQRDRESTAIDVNAESIDISENPFQDVLDNLEEPAIVGKRGDRE